MVFAVNITFGGYMEGDERHINMIVFGSNFAEVTSYVEKYYGDSLLAVQIEIISPYGHLEFSDENKFAEVTAAAKEGVMW